MILRRDNMSFFAALAAFAALCILSLAPLGAFAQQEPQEEAPTRVGRVADVGGQLFLAPEDRATEWAPIELNYPVGSGDNLWLSGEGRAEIDFGVGQLRIAGNTNVHVSRLGEREISLFVAQGRAIVALRVLEQGDVARIDTPNTQIELTRPGLYRIDVADDRQETTVVVREGEANVAVAGGLQQVLPGQTAQITGTTDVRADVRNGSGLDGFDTWSANRDRVYVRARGTRYVSNQMVGAADLDEYGKWETYPEYGAVWFPTTVAVDWAPYRYGHWVSVPVWGWTWVDYAPWGYAPFHYGRWAYVNGRWGWCPGEYVRRPAWAPALVAWYGGGSWGVSVSGGSPVYGWVPLGWREPYTPWWRNCGSRCWTAYNRPYAVNPTDRGRRPVTYVNNAVPGAITAVPGAAFASGKPVAPNIVRMPATMVSSAPVLGHTPPPVKPMPVNVDVVRPGNGVPPPASTLQSRTKPMLVAPQPGRPQDAITSAPPGRSEASVPPSRAITSAPPGRPATALQSSETPLSSTPPGRAPSYVRPAPAPAAAPPSAANSAAPRVAQDGQPGRGQGMRREGGPPPTAGGNAPLQATPQAAAPRPAPQGVPMPRPSPQGGTPAPQAVQVVPQPQGQPALQAVPQPRGGPQPQVGPPPHAEHGQGRGPEKPAAAGHPQPAQN